MLRGKKLIIVLTLLVLIGITKPLLRLLNIETPEELIALNISPGSIVFSNYRFFSEIKILFEYKERIEQVPISVIIDTGSDLYSGKMKYSLLYMDHIFSKWMASQVAEFYLCSGRINGLRELFPEKPISIRIEYVNRQSGTVKMVRKYLCKT